MTRIERSIEIDATVSDVFSYASDYENWTSFFAGVSDFRPMSDLKRGNGSRFSYYAKLLGMKARVETEISEFIENAGWQGITVRGVKSQTQWIFDTIDGKTRFTYILMYELPVPMLGGLADILFVRPAWERTVSKSLVNLKRIVERNTLRR